MSNKRTRWFAAGLALLALLMAGAYLLWGPKTANGEKTLAVRIIHGESARTVSIRTDAPYLRAALEQEKLIEGTEGPYGLFIQSVDGVAADDALQEWWCLTRNGETVNTGVDQTPVADGEQYELTLRTGY